ncbi:hypothetical protein ACVRWL_08075 [Streptococcus ratti]
MSYLSKVFFLEIDLIRKRFQIYGVFNTLSLLLVILSLLIGGKFLIFFLGNYPKLAPIVSLILLLMGLCNVAIPEDKLFKKLGLLRGFFPFLEIEKVRSYYRYRKFILSILLIFYLLVPLEVTNDTLKYFLIFINLLSFLTLINSLSTRYLSNSKKEMIYTMMKILYCGLLALSIRGILSIHISSLFLSISSWGLLLIYLVLFVINLWILHPRKER